MTLASVGSITYDEAVTLVVILSVILVPINVMIIWAFFDSIRKRLTKGKDGGGLYEIVGMDGSHINDVIHLQDGDDIVPLTVSRTTYRKCKELTELNPGKTLYIRAVIDRNDLTVDTVKGFLLKGDE